MGLSNILSVASFLDTSLGADFNYPLEVNERLNATVASFVLPVTSHVAVVVDGYGMSLSHLFKD